MNDKDSPTLRCDRNVYTSILINSDIKILKEVGCLFNTCDTEL